MGKKMGPRGRQAARPTEEQKRKLSEEVLALRIKYNLSLKELEQFEGFPVSNSTISRIELGGDYTQYTHDIVREWLDARQREEEKPQEPKANNTADAENIGILLAKITVIAEQINSLLELQKKDHEQLMQLTPYIQNWPNIRKKLQLWRYD